MTDKDPDTKTPAADAGTSKLPPHKRRRTGVAGGLALILAVVALLSSAYLGYTLITRRGLYNAGVSSQLQQLAAQNAKSQNELAAMGRELDTLKRNQKTLQGAFTKISGEFGRGRRQWLLSESAQLMIIADHRLQLAHNVGLALAALRAADQDLRQLDDPRYLPVRRTLADEIGKLEYIGHIDISGMALRLGDIAGHLDSLPLASGSRPQTSVAPAKVQTQRSQLGSMLHDLLSLVRIQRTNKLAPPPLLRPNEAYFLRQNLRLMLYGAQTALLRGNAAVFVQDVTAARRWIGTYYDGSATPVQSVEAELGRMLKSPFRNKLPDISGSLEQLRRIQQNGAIP